MSPSRLRLLALPTAPCKHGALFFLSFAWRERIQTLRPPLRLHLEEKKKKLQWPLTSVVRTAQKFTLMVDSVHSILYTTLTSRHVTFFLLCFCCPWSSYNKKDERSFFSFYKLIIKKTTGQRRKRQSSLYSSLQRRSSSGPWRELWRHWWRLECYRKWSCWLSWVSLLNHLPCFWGYSLFKWRQRCEKQKTVSTVL